jgi:CRISPR type I-D-associated protein Csc3/Cas10d
MQADPDDGEAASWAIPAFLALVLPLLTHTKLLLSESPLPPSPSGKAFPEAAVFDAPASYLGRILKKGCIQAHEVFTGLRLLTSLYLVNLDAFAKKRKPGWDHLPALARDLETDPARLFDYLKKMQKGDALYPSDALRYLDIYTLMEANMSLAQQTVDNYVLFYKGGYTTSSILAPVDRIVDAIKRSPPTIEPEDLQLQIQGQLSRWLERVRKHQAEGYALLWGEDKSEQEPALLAKFVSDFYQQVFLGYCQGERSLLHSRINPFRYACEVYYKTRRTEWQEEKKKQKEREEREKREGQTEAEAATATE